MDIINFALPVYGNFIVRIIAWLVKISSSIVVGIILFTVLLKVVTLPFDYFSKASMRKNSLKMEEMRPELEKLQKQYANDKALYNQKMMALYKKNGYSMFGSCLPTILTLVIFIFALNGFTKYSQYQNRLYFYNMSNAYNSVIYDGIEIDDTYIKEGKNGSKIVDYQKLFDMYNSYNGIKIDSTVEIETTKNGQIKDVKVIYTKTIKNAYNADLVEEQEDKDKIEQAKEKALEAGKEIYDRKLTVINGGYVITEKAFSYTGYKNKNIEEVESSQTEKTGKITWSNEKYKPNHEVLYDNTELKLKSGKTFKQAIDEDVKIGGKVLENNEDSAKLFIQDICQQKSADKYLEEQASFLWIKNIWITDSPTKSPLVDNWEEFRSTHAYPDDAPSIGKEGYNQLTKKLSEQKTQSNGYFILVVLTAGVSFLTQFVMKKSQKAQMELQTVDGQGAQTQKIMMVMMPVMMAIFAFVYTSAFSIYIILSSIINIGTTLGINKIVDIKFKKEQKKNNKDQKIRGRVYTPKEEPKKEEPKKAKKAKDKKQDDGFLSGNADGTKKIRGRLK